MSSTTRPDAKGENADEFVSEEVLRELDQKGFFHRLRGKQMKRSMVWLDTPQERNQAMWYLVLSHSIPEKEKDKQENYEDHRRWLDRQHRAGRLLFSGPTTDGRYGVYVMIASSLDEARQIAAEDPHHLRGIRRMEVLEWRAHRAFRLNGPTIADVEKMARPE